MHGTTIKKYRNWFVVSRANLSDGKHHVTGLFPQSESNKSLMKQPFVVTHRYTIVQVTEKLDRFSTDRNLIMLCFYGNIKTRIFSVAGKRKKDCPLIEPNGRAV